MARRSIKATDGPTHRAVEVGVAIATAAFAGIVIYGSIKAGINWGVEGPRAGFFPFYIALFILLSSVINLFTAVIDLKDGKLFAEWGQLWRVLSVVIPTAIFVALIPRIGIYFSSALLIALFMKWLGKYRWSVVALVAVGVPLANIQVFEKWFLVPLPKGPVEYWLGF